MATLPPWLTPAAAQGWGELAARGAQLQLERARIQQEGINANIRAQAQREQQQAEDARQQQQIQYEKSYRDAELGLKKQQADQQAQELAAQGQSMKQFSDFLAAGGDYSEGVRRFGSGLGLSGDTFARLAKPASAAFVPKGVTVDGNELIQVSPNHWTRVASKPTNTETVRQVLNPNYSPDGKNGPQFLSLTNRTTRLPSGTPSPSATANQPTKKDVDHLKAHPELRGKFDKEFGDGAADLILNPPQTGQDIP